MYNPLVSLQTVLPLSVVQAHGLYWITMRKGIHLILWGTPPCMREHSIFDTLSMQYRCTIETSPLLSLLQKGLQNPFHNTKGPIMMSGGKPPPDSRNLLDHVGALPTDSVGLHSDCPITMFADCIPRGHSELVLSDSWSICVSRNRIVNSYGQRFLPLDYNDDFYQSIRGL